MITFIGGLPSTGLSSNLDAFGFGIYKGNNQWRTRLQINQTNTAKLYGRLVLAKSDLSDDEESQVALLNAANTPVGGFGAYPEANKDIVSIMHHGMSSYWGYALCVKAANNEPLVGIGTDVPTQALDIPNGKVKIGEKVPGLYSVDGTSLPTAKLTVDGLAVFKKVICVSNDYWPDYVFRPGYRLRSLSEIEDYIKDNGHLPDMPSEKEVTEEGLDLVKTNARLLEKIEELTLHLIELEKAVNTLKAKGK